MKTIIKIFFIIWILVPGWSNADAQKPVTWQRTYDGGYNIYDEGFDICEADLDNFYLVGSSYAPVNSINNWIIKVIKINPYGDTLWTKEVRITGNIEAYKVINDNFGGCVITGKQGIPGAFFISINKFGNLNWIKNYGQRFIELHDIIRTNDNGYIACGMKRNVNIDCYIIKIDSLGNLVWQKEILSTFSKLAYSITEESNGDLVICGTQVNSEFGDTTRAFVLKTDNSGNILWNNNFRISNKYTSAYTISKSETGYIVCGETLEIPNYFSKVFFVKLKFDGNIEYQKEFITSQNEYSPVFAVSNVNKFLFGLTRDLSASESLTRFFITDSLGNVLKENSIKNINNKSIVLRALRNFNNISLFYIGKMDNELGISRDDFFVLRTDSLLNFPSVGIINKDEFINENITISSIYPNPFNPELSIDYKIINPCYLKIVIFNSIGKEISILENRKINSGKYVSTFNSISNPSGIYFASFLINGKLFKSFKLILIR